MSRVKVRDVTERSAYETLEVGEIWVISRENGKLPLNSTGFIMNIAEAVGIVYAPKTFTQRVSERGLEIERIT